MNHAETFFAAAAQICHDISFASIEALASELDRLRDRRGRLFLIGVGGSAANCSHAVNVGDKDAILIYSVGGGDAERKISANIIQAIDLAKARSAKVFGIVGRDSGYTAKHGDVVVLIPQVNPNWVTPLSEAFQAVVWHCLVSHPALQRRQTKW